MKVAIPFQGFYGSTIVSFIEDEVDDMLENQYYDGFSEDSVDWKATFLEVSREYASQWCYLGGYEGGFSSLKSPREYNFRTDEIFVEFTDNDLVRIKKLAMAEQDFSDFVEKQCSDRSGFISFLSPNLEDWYEWDERHYEVALMFLDEVYSYEEDIIESLRCNGGFSPILIED